MVLESVIVELINKFLGEYVENVDKSQLKVAFGGEVALDNLLLKQSALNELGLPVKTTYGRIGKLRLSIPWTNLYKAPWKVHVEGVFLLSVPSEEVKYDAEREERLAQDAKQKQLLKVEEAKKQEAEQGLNKKEDASFVENLVAHVIKNLQVTIKDIHIRYEDQITNLGNPFALGLTLSQLRLESTDEKGKPTDLKQTLSLFHKEMTMEGLAFYWNSRTKLYCDVNDTTKIERFGKEIATKDSKPSSYTYMFGPISAGAKLQFNPKPEHDGTNFTTPKIKLDMNMDLLSIGITKMQYRDLMKFLESMDRMARAAPYRRYRPDLASLKKDPSKRRSYIVALWKYAFDVVMETDVLRRRRNFDWKVIKAHRALWRKYEAAYKEKLESKKPSPEILRIVEECERKLDVFSLIIIRKQVDLKVQKIRKQEEESRKNAGWFGGWWGGGSQKPTEASGSDLASKFEAAMTAEEKAKLYQAIGYQENAAPAQYPPTFVETNCTFSLGSLQLEVRDEELSENCVVRFMLAGVTTGLQIRPSAMAQRVEVRMRQLLVTGVKQDGLDPLLAYSLTASGEKASLLDVLFETNPLDRACDQRLRVSAQPLELVYDAQTIIHIVDVFHPPETPSLGQLQAMAVSKMEEIKEGSATYLQHAILQQKILDLDIRFAASRMILPQGGKMKQEAEGRASVPLLVVSLGSLALSSRPRDPGRPSVTAMMQSGSTEQEVLHEMIAQSYDKFNLSLKDMQVLVASAHEDWQGMLHHPEDSTMHLVRPTSMEIDLHRSLLPNDPRIPQFKVAGKLPSLALHLSEERLLLTAGIFVSVPFPESSDTEPAPLAEAGSRGSSIMTLTQLGKIDRRGGGGGSKSGEAMGLVVGSVKLELSFEMRELRVTVLRVHKRVIEPLLDFSLLSLELEVTQRSFDMNVALRLGGICMEQSVAGRQHRVINTPMADGHADYLFTTRLFMVDRKSPEFHTVRGGVEKLLDVNFSSLDLLLHQRGILQLMEFANHLQEKVSSLQAQKPRGDRMASTRPAMDRLLSVIPEDGGPIIKPTGRARKHQKPIIQLRLIAKLENLSVELAGAERSLSRLALQGVQATVTMMTGQMVVQVELRTLGVKDLNPHTVHPQILKSEEGTKALSARVVMYENPTEQQPQMSVEANMACLRIFFLNRFVSNLLGFLNNFQAAVDRVKQASAAAAEAAKQNMQQAYENATRIKLDIEIKAPIILIPRSIKHSEAFLLDLGVIRVRNQFSELVVAEGQGKKLTLDVLGLSLTELHLSRVNLDEGDKVLNQSALIRPFDFNMDVERNLSVGWCKQRPGVSLRSNLAPIMLDVRQEDVTLAMLVLAENLADQEAPPPAEETETHTLKVPVEVAPSRPKRPTSLRGVPRQLTDEGVEVEETSVLVFEQMTFKFTMKSIEVTLLMPTRSPVKGQETHGLAHFTLSNLNIDGSMRSDDVMLVKLQLENCCLRDLRAFRDSSTERILNVMRVKTRRPTSLGSQQQLQHAPMIDVKFEKESSKSRLTATVSGFDLVLCLDYLMKLSDFFVSALPKVTAAPPAPAKPKPIAAPEKSGPGAMSRQLSNPPPEGVFELIVMMEQPDIVLVETMADINTKALIFSVEGECRVQVTPERQALNVEIKNIQLYSCCFNPAKRQETLSQVLRPCTLSVAGGCNTGKQPTLGVDLTAVRIAVSPVTIGILTNVLNTIGGGGQQEQESDEPPPPPDWSLIWRPKLFSPLSYWFLVTEEAQDALTMAVEPPAAPPLDGGMIMFTAHSLLVTVEAGTGIKTLPLMLLESRLEARVSNWSTKLEVHGDLSLQMSYYNSRLALWEPLIEPVEATTHDRQLAYVPWQLTFELKMNAQATPVLSPAISDMDTVDIIAIQPPRTQIVVRSEENLEVTVSRCCLDVLDALSKAFQTAWKEGLAARSEELSPYVVHNQTGMRVVLLLADTDFQVEVQPGAKPQHVEQVVLESGARIGLALRELGILSPMRGGSVLQDQVAEKILPIKVPDKNCVIRLPMARAEKRFFSLVARGEKTNGQGVVSELRMEGGSRVTTLRSILQVHNLFSLPVDVYFMTRRGNELEGVGVVQPGQKLDLPLHAVYTPTSEIFFSLPGHTVCITPFIWKELLTTVNISKTLRCDPKNKDEKDPFYFQAVGDMEQVFYEGTSMHTITSCVFNLTLRPTVVLHNLLPVPLICAAGRGHETEVPPGGQTHLATIEPGTALITLRLDDYLEKVWSCKREVMVTPPELAVWSFDSWDSAVKMTLDLGMHTVNLNGTLHMSLYAPFWMINKTGLMLSYRKSRRTEKNEVSGSPLKQSEDSTNVLYHPADFAGPILFSFRPKAFFGKKKACVKVEDSDWSNKFSLDVAGNSGSVTCKAQQQLYQLGVSIHLAHSTLTKMVTFTPYYLLVNHARYAIECQEADRPADPWTAVPPNGCSPFWPQGTSSKDHILRLRVVGSAEITAPFSFTESHTTLLKLHNKYGGISVDVQVSEGAIYINLLPYEPGLAPALIMNHTQHAVEFWEKGPNPVVRKLMPREECLFTWEDPRGSRLLVWNSRTESDKRVETKDMLRQDGMGRLWMPGVEEVLYWVSFLNGMQRVLLFTDSFEVVNDAKAAVEAELVAAEITLSLHGMGLSLVAQQEKKMLELLYMGIASSGVLWEWKKPSKSKWEAMSVQDCRLLEEAFKLNQSKTELSDKTEVDLELMEAARPHRRSLRRTYHPGLWLQLRTSEHQHQLHVKLHTLQVDCQMPDCLFPTILAPVPLPKSVAAEKAVRPFVEVSMVKRLLEHSTVQQFRYLRVLVQEFHVKLDMNFLNALISVFSSEESLEADKSEQVQADKQVVEQPLRAHIAVHAAQEQKNFYDELHLSPLKIHVSFSMSGGLSKQAANSRLYILNALLQNLGVTLTDLQDVVFKLGYFERQSTFLTQRQLTQEVTSHYTQQAVKQLYVLVLGLDVIGNPFGLVLGLKQGVEDLFYEPFQGAIQGPGEFAEGLKNGVRSLLGHTLSGTAAAMSRITGTVGKTLANLSFDEEYQRKRREQQMNRPAALHEGLVQSGKGLVTGVVSGVTGVITKPISGARDEGVGGFFKGIGAGVIGLVTQPTGGVIDFASNTLDTVKRAADTADETKALRFPRFFQQDGLIRPYSVNEAYGSKLLSMVDKGRYSKTDNYVFHAVIGHSRKEAVFLTDKRVLFASRNDLFGQWQMEWNYPWTDLPRPLTVETNGVMVHTAEPQRKMLGLFKSSESSKLIIITEEHLKQKICDIAKKIMDNKVPKSPPR